MRFCLQAVFVAAIATVSVAEANEIGSVAAVNRDMNGTPPQAEIRALTLGNRVYQNEKIETSGVGSGQLMFMDQTTLTVAPDSDILLDEYVYDPETSTGRMTLNLGRGMLRLVGGRITKTSEAIIQTPAATIGIRGGMALIEVLADGTTRVVLLAGEYAVITDRDGHQIYLSRPNAEAEIGSSGLVFNGLLRTPELRRYFGRLEGTGTGGAGLSQRALAEVEERTERVSALNSGVRNGVDEGPLSTSGERPVDRERTETRDVRDEDRPDEQISFSDTGGGTPPAGGGGGTPPPGGGGTPPTGGGGGTPPVTGGGGGTPPALPSTGGAQFAGQGPATFTNIAFGSLIGTDAAGRTITLPAAETAGDFVNLSGIPGAESFTLGEGNANAGIVLFGETDGAASSQFGVLEGFGYSDLDENFHYFLFESVPADPTGVIEPVAGYALFGDPSPNQLRFFTADDGTLDGEIQNVTEVFDVNNFVDFTGAAETPPAIFVKNADIDRRSAGNGARLIFADERIRDDSAGGQISEFGVYLGDDRGAAGVHFDGTFLSTENDSGTLFSSIRPFNPIQTAEGATGPTVFGSNDDYVALGPVSGLPGSQVFEAGEISQLGQPAEAAEFGGALLERDAAAAALIDDPIPLAGQNLVRGGNGLFDAGAISGIAFCSSGNCGASSGAGNQEGVYVLNGDYGDSVRMEFNSTGLDTNAFQLVRLRLTGEDSGMTGANDFFEFRVNQPGESGYVDDSRFVVSQQDAPQTLAGVNSTSNSATLLMAASDTLAFDQTPGLPSTVDFTPEFVRWGRWSTVLDVEDALTGERREDIVHLGSWMAGIAPDASLIPDTGSVTYSGLAVGTDLRLDTLVSTAVFGGFSMTYDFGRDRGSFNLFTDNFAFSVPGDFVSGLSSDRRAYEGFSNGAGTQIAISGGFFEANGDPVAATGGNFEIRTTAQPRLISGVFAGDRQP